MEEDNIIKKQNSRETVEEVFNKDFIRLIDRIESTIGHIDAKMVAKSFNRRQQSLDRWDRLKMFDAEEEQIEYTKTEKENDGECTC